MNTERWIAKLEAESKALKQVFDRSATSLPVFTKIATFNTTKNLITTVIPGYGPFTQEDQERVVVTFNTTNGSNTIGKLEISTSNQYLPVKRLRIFSGGCQWVVTNSPNKDSSGNWLSTSYNFTVQSFVDGSITVTEATS